MMTPLQTILVPLGLMLLSGAVPWLALGLAVLLNST